MSPAPRCQLPLLPAQPQRATLGAFARLSLRSGNALAPEGLSPESVVTLCLLGGKPASLASCPSPWACKAVASAGAGGCRLGRGRLPRQGQPGQRWAMPRAAVKHVRVLSTRREGVLLQRGFERGFCYAHPTAAALPPVGAVSLCASHPSAGLGSTLCPACARQRDRVPGALSLPFLLATAELCSPPACALPRSLGRSRPRAAQCPLCACPASECPWCL